MSSPATGKWNDLSTRVVSALAMVMVGVVCIWQGGMWFRVLVAGVSALMMWELLRMRVPGKPLGALLVGTKSGLAVLVFPHDGFLLQALLVLVPAITAGAVAFPHWRIAGGYALLIVLGSDTLVAVRDELGVGWLVWLVAIVVVSDVAGYFAGKALGGPKFWPAISPKKTWSGTGAGWIGAACVGAVFGLGSGAWWAVVVISVLLCFAGQMGDILESAIKRRSGVKDSSSLIPGHGGVLDRFDGLLGASLMLLVVAWVTGFPAGLF